MQNDSYPATVQEVIDDEMTFKPTALVALRSFKQARPWAGDLESRHRKFRDLHKQLCQAYGLPSQPRLIFGNDHTKSSGQSCFIPAMNVIILRGRLSLVTYLHEFAHARGMNERSACRWSINVFRRIFRKQFDRCRHDGHMLVMSPPNRPE
jgi:hypothetical protein